MGKTGRTLDMVDLPGRTARRRRRARINSWIGRLITAGIAVTTAVFAVIGAVRLVSDQGNLAAYDKAPYCAAQAVQTQTCVLRTTADIGYVYASKNTGKNAHGYTTKAYVYPVTGHGETVTLSSSQDLTDSVYDGDTLPVLVWRDQITRFTFHGSTHDADENPHHIVLDDVSQVALCLIAASLFGRSLIRRLLHDRVAINLRRNRIPDWTLVVLALGTTLAAIVRASYAVTALGLAGVAVLALSAAWPFVPWVATYSEQQPFVVGSRANARAVRKRTQARPGRLP
ncbi:hypothetical protein ABH926_009831 [Catenulispora sp. GP43]|uniref:hypothetical protein n=1 Tax=Catenulispora sp. GP43 TaxID=3156263 RepID=UPI003512B355